MLKTVDETLNYIHSYFWKGSIPGLSRTNELLERMGNPHKKLKFVHIAGTNGKGSTASMLASVLTAAGYCTGLYTSPYINCFNERMQVSGRMIEDELLIDIVNFVKPHAEAMTDHPTEFELVTAIGMEYFARKNCDIVVLEVGMGGELDSTNVIDTPEAAVIVNIGLDHTDVLGNTLEEIASAKAGIIKGGDAVLYRCSPSVEAVFEEKCAATGTRLHKADFDSIRLVERSLEGQTFCCGGLENLEIRLLGEHQLRNAAVVLKTLEVLQAKGWNITEEQLRKGLKDTAWPGRFEVLRKEPLFIIDGGHNPQCMAALAENMAGFLPDRPITALTGVMADKDFSDMYRLVAPYITRYVTVTPGNPRAMAAEKLAEVLSVFGKPVTPCATVAEGVKTAIAQTEANGAVLAFGSLYMLGDIRTAVEELN
ncbi:MAG: bifunctional folylpolyglutamate synthase/dihydrofolate synthase [Oscillospiraceae bacterium]|nr:bifunctional folylpolyglutamate synthase/dihydrofolate synthase [Oscillospiraceae bacterium]